MSLKYKLVRHIYAEPRFKITRVVNESIGRFELVKIVNSEFLTVQSDDCWSRDYEILKELDSETIIKASGLEKQGKNTILTLEDFDGQSFARFIEQQDVNLSSFLKIGIQLTEALETIHHHCIVHQKIQPSSILIDPISLKLKLIDFSFATRTTTLAKVQSQPKLGLDTAYIAPEQTGRMNIALDYRADFYSLGILLYRLLVGALPYQAQNFLELIHCHLAQIPVAPHDRNPKIEPTISSIVVKLLAKNPDARYQSATAIKSRFETLPSSISQSRCNRTI